MNKDIYSYNSGNIVIDSLIGYWYVEAKKVGIDFSVNLNIPMEMPFRGADICRYWAIY